MLNVQYFPFYGVIPATMQYMQFTHEEMQEALDER